MTLIRKIIAFSWLAISISILGAIFFASQTWNFIHTQMSIDDEGNYILKGLMFVRGQYEIFQDYGPWSNHMPLSFMIPGAILDWFGPTLENARLLAFTLGLLLLLGIWIVARRWGGNWWAAFAVWSMALNPAILKIYSLMTSQVIIACMLVWVFVFTLAEKRPLWHLLLGAAFGGAMLLTRLNLAPVLPLLIFYIYWQHGKRPAVWSTMAMLTVVIIGHALYWPGILRMWAAWIPAGLAPFLQTYRAPDGIAFWNPQIDLDGRLISIFWGLRYHFVGTVGVLATLLLWPRKSDWKNESQRRATIFLTTLFLVLYLLHGYVTVGAGIASNNAYSTSYCIFCLPTYMGFFSFTGILLIVIAAPSWRKILPLWRQGLIGFLILGLPTGIGYSSFGNLGDWLATQQFPTFTHRWLRPNTLRVWKYLNYRYAITFQEAKRVLPIWGGILTGMLVLITTAILQVILCWKKKGRSPSFGYLAMITLLIIGWLISPTLALGGGYQSYDCNTNVTEAYDELGANLQNLIPPGSTIYWQGEPASTGLIYLSDVQIFPAQLNQKFTFFEGETDALEKYGFWNQELAERWLAEADYALVGTLYYNDIPKEDLASEIQETDFYNVSWLVEGLSSQNGYQLIDQASIDIPCHPGQIIQIFQKVTASP